MLPTSTVPPTTTSKGIVHGQHGRTPPAGVLRSVLLAVANRHSYRDLLNTPDTAATGGRSPQYLSIWNQVVAYTSNGQTLQQIAHANGITDKEVLDAVANRDLVDAKSNIAGQGPLGNVIARYDIVRPDHREALHAHALISAENDAYAGGEDSASLFGLTDEADLDAVQRAALYGAMNELNQGATPESVGDDFGVSQIALDFHPLPNLNCAREHAYPGSGDAIRRTALDGAFNEFGKGAPLADVMNKYGIRRITVASGRRPVTINLDRQNARNVNQR